jgi:hypothetical protein
MKLSMLRRVPLSATCRVSCQNKFVKLVHLVGFIIKKFVTVHGHMNVKKYRGKIFLLLHIKNNVALIMRNIGK